MKIIHINRDKIRREQQIDQFQKDLRAHLEALDRKRAWRKFNQLLKGPTK
jgi:hypothetical protein